MKDSTWLSILTVLKTIKTITNIPKILKIQKIPFISDISTISKLPLKTYQRNLRFSQLQLDPRQRSARLPDLSSARDLVMQNPTELIQLM